MEPSREGARGGRDQFNWADVKAMPQNERDHYLGARRACKLAVVRLARLRQPNLARTHQAGRAEEGKLAQSVPARSVHALPGAWTKGKDVYWYTRDKAAEQQQEDELAFIKQREVGQSVWVPAASPARLLGCE